MRPVPIVLMVALLLTGCSAQATHDAAPISPARDPAPAAAPAATSTPPPMSTSAPSATTPTLAHLDGTSWRFVEVAGAPVPPAVHATLHLRGGHASGKAGCNAFGAAYHIGADGSARFQQALSTRMACPQPPGAMKTEHGVFAAFHATAKVRMQQGQLVLLDADGRVLAELAPADGP